MAGVLQFRRGTTAEASLFTGASGELFVDIQQKILYLHDGIQTGGFNLSSLIGDTNPTLSSNLNANGNNITNVGPGNEQITDLEIINWNQAFNWGNHAEAGYLTSVGTIDGHSDVSVLYPNDGQILMFDNASGTWKNQDLVTSNASFVSPPITSLGVSGDDVGMFSGDSTYFYYCTGAYDGVTDIWKRIANDGSTW